MFQHGLHGNHIGVNLTPGEGLDGGVDDIGAVAAHLEDACHGETGTAVTVIFDDDLGVFVLDHLRQLTEHRGLSDACHVFETDFGCTGFDELVSDGGVVFGSVNRGVGDAERGLGRHACFEGILDGRDDVSDVVESAEDAGDVNALCMLHLVHQLSDVGGHGEHAERVKSAVEHVGFDAHFVEGFCEGAHCLVGVLAI